VAIPVALRQSEARVPVLTGRFHPFALAILAPLALSACGGHTNVLSAGERCSEQVILSLAPGILRTDRVIKDISRSSDVHLEYLRSASTNLHVFTLTSNGKDPQCHDALARLRQDSHVRFAEPDAHRSHFDALK
jgi:hypothetical protein